MRSIPRLAALALLAVCAASTLARAEEKAAFNPGEARRISADDLKKRMDAGEKPIILDTRFATGDTIAKGAVHVTNDKIEAWAKDVPKDKLVVAYCT